MLTSYYRSPLLDPSQHFLVRTSVGPPRFCPHRMDASLELLYPEKAWLKLKRRAYTARYSDRLRSVGFESVSKAIDGLKAQAGSRELVFLCFESLSPPLVAKGQFCHRRIFADWWFVITGEEIPELRAPTAWGSNRTV